MAFLTLGDLFPISAQDLKLESPTSGTGNVADLLARGSLAQERGELTTALQYYREAVEAFDRQRPMMAEALLRLAENYRAVGAVASSEEIYRRIVVEFPDQKLTIQKVPKAFHQAPKREAEELSITTSPNFASRISYERIDPKKEEMQVVIETAKRRLENIRSNVESAYDELQRAAIRRNLVRNASHLSLPSSVSPGIGYEELKSEKRNIERTMKDSKEKVEQLKAADVRVSRWVRDEFIPSLESASYAAEEAHERWKQMYDVEFDKYREILRVYRDVQIQEEKRLNEEAKKNDLRAKEEALVLAEEQKAIKFAVLGNVKSPGFYEVPPELKVSVLQAIAMAGGFDPNADKRKLQVKRVDEVVEVSIQDEMRKVGAEQFLLRAGDTVIVGERLF